MKEIEQTIIRMLHICNANIVAVALDMVASEPTQTQ